MTSNLRRLGGAALALGLIAAASGCTRIRNHQGFVLDKTLVDTVQPGVDNKDSVSRTLGRPSFVGEFDEKSWYYVARDTRQLAFSNPKPIDQTVLIVKFDGAGNVASVEKTGLDKIASVSPSGDKTPTLGRDRGFFSELFGNIGRVGGSGTSAPTADNPD